MSEFRIQNALSEDVEWIANVQVSMAMETENLKLYQKEVVKGVKFIFDHPDRGFYVVTRKQERIPVGCLLILKEWSDWRNGDVWWIHSLYVAPAYRKHGIFRKMFEYIENLARNSAVRGLRLYVDKGNIMAQQAYGRLGMSKDHYELFEKMF